MELVIPKEFVSKYQPCVDCEAPMLVFSSISAMFDCLFCGARFGMLTMYRRHLQGKVRSDAAV